MGETRSLKCVDKIRFRKLHWIERVGQGMTQGACRHVRVLREKHGLVSGWKPESTASPRPEAGNGPKEDGFSDSVLPDHENPVAGSDFYNRLVESEIVIGNSNGYVVKL